MSGTLLNDHETAPWPATIWKFMIPKQARYLSELYEFLGAAVRRQPDLEPDINSPPLHLDGYSIYEVDGAYRGKQGRVYEERLLVVRLILPQSPNLLRLRLLGRKLLELTGFKEEEVWIVEHAGSRVHSFRPPVFHGE